VSISRGPVCPSARLARRETAPIVTFAICLDCAADIDGWRERLLPIQTGTLAVTERGALALPEVLEALTAVSVAHPGIFHRLHATCPTANIWGFRCPQSPRAARRRCESSACGHTRMSYNSSRRRRTLKGLWSR
jgi:hypothetical protein